MTAMLALKNGLTSCFRDLLVAASLLGHVIVFRGQTVECSPKEEAGASAIQLEDVKPFRKGSSRAPAVACCPEDQEFPKKCGHTPGRKAMWSK